MGLPGTALADVVPDRTVVASAATVIATTLTLPVARLRAARAPAVVLSGRVVAHPISWAMFVLEAGGRCLVRPRAVLFLWVVPFVVPVSSPAGRAPSPRRKGCSAAPGQRPPNPSFPGGLGR